MPRRYKKSRRRRKGKSFASKLMRAAKKPGINSIAERAVALIAKKEAEKLIAPNLIFRRACFGEYSRLLNIFQNPTKLDINGCVLHMAQIPLNDNTTNVTVAPSADLFLRPTVPQYPRGANVIATTTPTDGYRTGPTVQIKNLGASLRLFLPALNTATSNTRREDVTVTAAIVAVQEQDMDQLQWKPQIDTVMPFKGLAYSSRLDVEISQPVAETKFQVLTKARMVLKYDQYVPKERFMHLFTKWDKRYEYQPYIEAVQQADQNGQRVVGSHKVFLVIRSDIPAGTPADLKVDLAGFIKCGYRNHS